MDQIKALLAKYRISTHTVAFGLAFLISAYYGDTTVQRNFDQAYVAMPNALKWIVGTVVALFMWYRNPASSTRAGSEQSRSDPARLGPAASAASKAKNAILLLLLPALAVGMAMTACSPSALTNVEAYVNLILPAVETAANVVIQTEAPDIAALAQAVEGYVNSGLRQIETLASTIAGANTPSVRQQVVAIADGIKSQLGGLLAAGQIKNPTTMSTVTQLVTAADALVDDIVRTIPANQTTALSPEQRVQVKTAVHQFKHRYNEIVSTKTGDPKVDAALSQAPQFVVLGWQRWHPSFR